MASTEAAAQRIEDLGGELLLAPVMFPDGHGGIAVARDPQGAVFSIFTGETHP